MLFLELPNEILWCILHFVPPQDSLVFLKTCKSLYHLKNDELFWRELARHYGVIYLHSNQSWWQLYVSGDLKKTCSHIHSFYRSLNDQIIKQNKCDLLWDTLLLITADSIGNGSNHHQEQKKSNCCQEQKINGICLYPGCQFKGCGDASFAPESNPGHLREHYQATGHTLVLKLSSLHFCELFCYACNKPVGFWGFPSMDKPMGERYLVRCIIQTLMNTLPTDQELKKKAIECRRAIERRLVWSQQSHEDSYIIERKWFMRWNEFLFADNIYWYTEKSDQIPDHLTNKTLFKHHDVKELRSDIELGTDFELVGGVVRSYIERVYDIDGSVISAYELQWKPEYRKISESILFRRHIMQRGPQGVPTDL